MRAGVWAALVLLACLTQRGAGQATPTAFINARIITAATTSEAGALRANEPAGSALASVIENGVLVVQGGRIVSVGDAQMVVLPGDAVTIDCAGKTIIPGLVDTHSHIGGAGGADSSATMQPEVRVFDSINPADSGFKRALAGGITTMNVMPGSGHLLSGQTIYLKPRASTTIEGKFFYRTPSETPAGVPWPFGGVKMANGTNSLGEAPFSGTRAKSAALVRERFIKAQEYRTKWQRYEADRRAKPETVPPERDLGLEALVEALEGRRIVHHHTHRADDIMTVLRLREEFGFRVVLHHTSEAWKVPEELARAQRESAGAFLGCSIILVDSPGGKLEAANMDMACGGVLERAGVATCIHTDDWINDSRLFLRSGALAVRFGMSREAALSALTLAGARMLDLGDRVGSLEAGKDADFVVLSGDPFSVYTQVEQTWIEGVKQFDRTTPDDALYATGGFGAGRDQEPYLCCAPSGGFLFGGKVWGQ